MIPEECGSCRFFRRNEIGQPRGVCRSLPPVPLMSGMAKHPVSGELFPVIKTYWPEIPDTEWCGGYVRKVYTPLDLESAELEGSA